jgi:hypothetical protein
MSSGLALPEQLMLDLGVKGAPSVPYSNSCKQFQMRDFSNLLTVIAQKKMKKVKPRAPSTKKNNHKKKIVKPLKNKKKLTKSSTKKKVNDKKKAN